MRKKIAFCHIHKTAGTTVAQYLRTNYSESEVFPATRLDMLNQRLLDSINAYSLIVGHFPLSFLRAFLSSEWKIITVLRDPNKRFASHIAFNHQLAHASSKVLPPIQLEDWRQDIQSFSDYQTKFLGTWLSKYEWRYLVANRKVFTFHLTEEWLRGGVKSAFRIAIEEVGQLDAVIWNDDLDGGLQQLAMTCGLWPFEGLPVTNLGKYADGQQESGKHMLLDIAQDNNAYDMQLCEMAKVHFAKQPASEEWDSYHKLWMQQYAPSRSRVIAADHFFLGTGWTGPYYTPDKNGFYWSDTSVQQSLYIPFTMAGHYEIEFSIFLPDRKPGFTMELEVQCDRISPFRCDFEGDKAYMTFRFDCVETWLSRLVKFSIVTDCTTQIRETGGIPNAGFIFSAAIVKLRVVRS